MKLNASLMKEINDFHKEGISIGIMHLIVCKHLAVWPDITSQVVQKQKTV